ncbi:hypothetical protein [Fredinandcohnia sp. 179-A 10B2 NHS]|uniref:hypothetical protein n=1 Tax=Fredinandcohnia sp. 179-A 10B2 NHS TaxID=3235176 RepID=UPI0039A19DDF
MNFSAGMYHTIHHPRLIIIPLVVNVLLTFLGVIGTYFGIGPLAFPTVQVGESQAMGINATFPFWIPLLEDLKFPYHFLQENPSNSNWIFSVLLTFIMILIKSYAIGMYLGSMKSFMLGLDNTYSTLKIGKYYFKRMVLFSLIETIISVVILLLSFVIGPLVILLFIGLLLYSLTPYIIVLEDISVTEAIRKSPKIFKRNFKTLFLLALLSMFFTFFITMLTMIPREFSFYLILLSYSFIGTVLIFAVMNCLHSSLHETNLPVKKVKKSKYLYPMLSVLTWILPLLGLWLATGQFVKAFDFRDKTELTGIHYMANWSDAYSASDYQYTTYNWEDEQIYKIEISLPDFSVDKEFKQIKGTGTVTWAVDEESINVIGNTTHYRIFPKRTKTDFMFRLEKKFTDSGDIYYSSENGTASFLGIGQQGHEPLSMGMMVSGSGENVFLYHYPTRFDVTNVIRVDSNGEYLIPNTSEVNPDDFKYFWFTKDLTTDKILEFLRAKNEFAYISNERLVEQLAAGLQEADGYVVRQVKDILEHQNIKNNLPDWSIDDWNEYLEQEYSGESIQSLLQHLNPAGNQFSYEIKELPRTEEGYLRNEREIPFPRKKIVIQDTFDEDGVLKELFIEFRH